MSREVFERLLERHDALFEHPARRTDLRAHNYERLSNGFLRELREFLRDVRAAVPAGLAAEQVELAALDLRAAAEADEPDVKSLALEDALSHLHFAVDFCLARRA